MSGLETPKTHNVIDVGEGKQRALQESSNYKLSLREKAK